MTAPPPLELVQQPRVQDVQAGRPYRIIGIPVQTDGSITAISYWLEIAGDDKYGATVVFGMGPNDLPTFAITAQQTVQLGTLLAAMAPCGFDNTGGTTSMGWYRIWGQGTDNSTTEIVQILCGQGPVLVRLETQLTRKSKILLGSGPSACGCGGVAAGCGCATGCTTCDHPPVTDTMDSTNPNILTTRARIKGRWRGTYSELTAPPDGLGVYVKGDVVVTVDGRKYLHTGACSG